MAEQHYDYNAPYEPEKTIKGGAFVRNVVVVALLAGMAGFGVMIANTPSSGQLGAPQERVVADNRFAPAYAPPVTAPPPGASEPQTAAPAPAPVTRSAPRAAPAAAEPEFTPSAPPQLPAPANPDMTIPDIVEPLPPTEG